jgi:hypothetical protein
VLWHGLKGFPAPTLRFSSFSVLLSVAWLVMYYIVDRLHVCSVG